MSNGIFMKLCTRPLSTKFALLSSSHLIGVCSAQICHQLINPFILMSLFAFLDRFTFVQGSLTWAEVGLFFLTALHVLMGFGGKGGARFLGVCSNIHWMRVHLQCLN